MYSLVIIYIPASYLAYFFSGQKKLILHGYQVMLPDVRWQWDGIYDPIAKKQVAFLLYIFEEKNPFFYKP